MVATPWIKIPPHGYGGIEVVVSGVVRELVKMGVQVDLFTVSKSRIKGARIHYLYKDEQYRHIHKQHYDSSPIDNAHVLFALNHIRANSGSFDIIHDHNPYTGPLALRWATELHDMPPAVHTNHGPPFGNGDIESSLPNNIPMWKQLGGAKRLYNVGI